MELQSGVQSLDRAFELLELLSRHCGGLHLMELSRMSGLNKSTTHRLLLALVRLGYAKNNGDGSYSLTLKLLELSGRITDGIDIQRIAKPKLDDLRDRCGEAVHLLMREGGEVIYVYKAESTNSAYRMFSSIGMRRAMYCTAAGKSILASLGDSEVKAIWDSSEIIQYTSRTIVTLDSLKAELEKIRLRGYAVDDEENELGVRCIAASIVDYTKTARAAFSISAPVVRMPDERIHALSDEVLAVRECLSVEAGANIG